MKTDILFATWPYVALGASAGGLVVRYLLLRRRIDAAKTESGQAMAIFAGGPVWRISLCILLAIHVVVLAAPQAILAWNGVPLRLYVLEGSGFLFGSLALGGWAEVMWRYLARPCPCIKSAVGDAVLLGLLFVVLASGFFMKALYRWGSSWGAVTLTPYVTSVIRGKPATDLVDELPFLVRLHVASSFGVLVALPFSRVASFLVVALHGAVAATVAPAGRAIRGVAVRLTTRAAAFIWEDDTDPDMTAPDWQSPSRSGIVPTPRRVSAQNAGEADTLHETVSKAK